jgi:beta-phosphoglucomutase
MKSTNSKTPAKAVIFDMDGVLVDNHAFHIKAWKAFSRRHQKAFSEEELNAHITGRSTAEIIPHFFGEGLSKAEIEQLGEEKEALYRQLYQAHLTPSPGLEAFLQQLRQGGWQLAIATSAPGPNLRFTLNGLGMGHYFATTVDSSGVARGKPAPDLYLKAAEVLEVDPKRCIVFEDSKAGIRAAQAAGMAVIALSTTHSREELLDTGLQRIIASFKEIDLNQLDQLVHEAH